MKKVLKIFAMMLVFCVAASLTAGMSKAETEKIISQIRADYKKTEENAGNYKVREVRVSERHKTTEFLKDGDTVRFYTEDGQLRKIIVSIHYDGNRLITEYYIKNGNPYFIAETEDELMGEKPRNVMTARYYFSPDKKLIRLMYNGRIEKIEKGVEAGKLREYREVKGIK